jgi:deazaflavin-dependent oxidoreductase (nitroreductase family)
MPPRLTDPEIADAEYAYLTTIGRVSGEPHTVELWFVTDPDTIWFFSNDTPDWQRNARANSAVHVRIGPWTWDATAQFELPAEMTRAGLTARTAVLAKYQADNAGDLNAWARDSLALGARVLADPQPSTETRPAP